MGEPSPLAIYLAIFAGALLLYAFIWYATRSLPRMAQILARLHRWPSLFRALLLYLSARSRACTPISSRQRRACPPARR